MTATYRILILMLVTATILGTSSADEEDLSTIVEGVAYHDQLIRTFSVSYTLKKGEGSGPERLRHGECIFADGMILATDTSDPAITSGRGGTENLLTVATADSS